MSNQTIIFTDGACSGNGKKCSVGGIGIYIKQSNLKLDNKLIENLKINKKMITGNDYSPTNIRAEGLAILYSLLIHKLILLDNINSLDSLINELNNSDYNNLNFSKTKKINYTIQIFTDSKFWCDVVTNWMYKWNSKNIINEKKNPDIVNALFILIENFKKYNIDVIFTHIRGHPEKNKKFKDFNNFELGNSIADVIACDAKKFINTDFNFILQ